LYIVEQEEGDHPKLPDQCLRSSLNSNISSQTMSCILQLFGKVAFYRLQFQYPWVAQGSILSAAYCYPSSSTSFVTLLGTSQMPTIIFCDSSHFLIVQKFVTVMDYSLHFLASLWVCVIEGRNQDTYTNSSTLVAILFGLHSVAKWPTAHQCQRESCEPGVTGLTLASWSHYCWYCLQWNGQPWQIVKSVNPWPTIKNATLTVTPALSRRWKTVFPSDTPLWPPQRWWKAMSEAFSCREVNPSTFARSLHSPTFPIGLHSESEQTTWTNLDSTRSPLGLVHQPTTANCLVPVPIQSQWSPSGVLLESK